MQRLAEQVLIIFPAVNNGGGSSREYNDLHGPVKLIRTWTTTL